MVDLAFNVYDKEGRWIDSLGDYQSHRITGFRDNLLDPQVYEVLCTTGLTHTVEVPWNGRVSVEAERDDNG